MMDQASKLVIAIDFGTTSSGISFSAAPRPDNIQHWPRTPVEYLDWGCLEYHPGFEVSQGFGQHEWMKLLLGQDVRPTQFDYAHLREMYGSRFEKLSLGKTAQDVLGDYLRELYLYAMQKLQEELGANVFRTITTECWVTTTRPLQQLLPGKPAAWKRHEHFSAHQESSPSNKRHLINTSDYLLVCDLGGGTTDINILNVLPYSEAESDVSAYSMTKRGRVRVSGHSYRTSFCDREIKTYLEDRKQFSAHTRTQPGIVTLLDRSVTPSPEPSKSQLYHYQRLPQRGNGIFPNVREPKIMKISESFIGDEGFGPNFGKPNMGREDDDDDNCVGFRRFFGLAKRSSTLFHGGERHGRARGNYLLAADQHGTIPRFGPPKRDPVAAAMGGNVKRSADETTLRVWRDAINRTWGGTTGRGPTEAKKWEEIGWKSAWEMHGNVRGEGGLICAY